MKKFGAYKGITINTKGHRDVTSSAYNNNDNNVGTMPNNLRNSPEPKGDTITRSEDKTTERPTQYIAKPSLSDTRRKYEAYLLKHRILSESLDYMDEDE